MITIEVFTAKWDKHYNDVMSEIQLALTECHEQADIKTLDIEHKPNEKLLEKHIQEMERNVGIDENPVRAVPLVVINNKPVIVGIGPDFRDVIKRHIGSGACGAGS